MLIFAISKNNKKWGQHYKICNNVMKTYDIYFNDSSDSNNKGFASTLDYCMDYINTYNGTDESFSPITKAAQCLSYAMRQVRQFMKFA